MKIKQAFKLVEEMNQHGFQIQMTTYPPKNDESSRPVVIVFDDLSGERAFEENDSVFYGEWDLADAIAQAHAYWKKQVKV